MKSIWKSLGLAAALISSGTASAEEQVPEIDFDTDENVETDPVEEPTPVDDDKITEQDVLSVCLDKRKEMMARIGVMDRLTVILANAVAEKSVLYNRVNRQRDVGRCFELYDTGTLTEVGSVIPDKSEDSLMPFVADDTFERLAICVSKSAIPTDVPVGTIVSVPSGEVASDSAHINGSTEYDRVGATGTDAGDLSMLSLEVCVDEVVSAKATEAKLATVSDGLSATLDGLKERDRKMAEIEMERVQRENEVKAALEAEQASQRADQAAEQAEKRAQMLSDLRKAIDEKQKALEESIRASLEAQRQEELARIEAAQKEEAARQQRLQELLKILQGQ